MNPPTLNPTLPRGETDPNKLYIAVGRAIHAWEGMEEALARLYVRMMGLPERPDAVTSYGAENRKFIERFEAIKTALERYFARFPNQEREGELLLLLQEARDLSIKRHRIAHGHITQWGEFKIPENVSGAFTLQAACLYRWGAPWYSAVNLRSDPVGGDAASIEAAQREFEVLWTKIAKFTSELPPIA
jgi:hypothetical protein